MSAAKEWYIDGTFKSIHHWSPLLPTLVHLCIPTAWRICKANASCLDVQCIYWLLQSSSGAHYQYTVPMFVNVSIISLYTPGSPLLCQLLDYIQRTWVYSSVWSPESWSQSQRNVHTNNDCEGWHRKLNKKIHRPNLPFYQLITDLYNEAELIETQA